MQLPKPWSIFNKIPHFEHIVPSLDLELLVYLVLDMEAMVVPVEEAGGVVVGHGLESRDDALDGSGQDMVVVRETGGEGRAIIENVL